MLAARISISFLLALILTAIVFWTLQSMVSVVVDIADLVSASKIEFTRMRRDTEVATKREEKAQREKPKAAPTLPRMSFASSGPSSDVVRMISPTVDTSGARMSLGAGSDRDVIPLVRINPDYPQRALSRGIEGWVQVQFTITAAGTVKDAKVVDADPKNIFDDAALKAIARWRYNPKVQEGVAVERVGVQTIIRFEIEE
jgi:protein TonB